MAQRVMAAALTRPAVEAIVRAFQIPASVVRTRPTGDSADWLSDDHRDLLHDRWEIRTTDAETNRNGTYVVGFDPVVDPGGTRLSADGLLRDALTKRIACLAMLSGSSGRRRPSATTVFRFSHSYDWHVRFRLSLSVKDNSGLREEHWESFLSYLVGSGDLIDLVPIDERMRTLLIPLLEQRRLAARAAARTDPVTVAAFPGNPPRLSCAEVARGLGVTETSIFRSQRVRTELMRILGDAFDVDRERWDASPPSDEDDPGADDYEDPEGKRPVARSRWSIVQLTDAWMTLSLLTRRGALPHDPLGYDPFTVPQPGLAGVPAENGPPRNPTVNPPYFLAYMNAAATWILDYAPHVLGAIETLRNEMGLPGKCLKRERTARRIALSHGLDPSLPVGMPRLRLSWAESPPGGTAHGQVRIGLQVAVGHLMTAALILLCGFGALTQNEALNLKVGCITQPKPGLFMLKTAFDTGVADEDGMPVPAMLSLVIDVLERLTARTRESTGEQWLLKHARDQFRDQGRGRKASRFSGFPKDRYLEAFAGINSLPVIDGESGGRLDGAQLRRAFAVCYYHAAPAASLDALCRFRRQFDPEMTRSYVEGLLPGRIGELREQIEARTRATRMSASSAGVEAAWLADAAKRLGELKARASIFNDVRCEAYVKRMLGIVAGRDVPVGGGGAKLIAEVNALQALVRAELWLASGANDPDAGREPLQRRLRKHAETHWMEPIPGNPAYCTCLPNDPADLGVAACLVAKGASRASWKADQAITKGHDRPDFAYSGIVTCLRCPHGAAFEENRRVIAVEQARIADTARRAGSPGARVAAEAIVDDIMAALVQANALGGGAA